ncbi:MAG: thioesterase family protein [Bacteroidales bacterium]|nr:thioesterase family protein [Bacteroidales bacterium]
MDFKIRSGIRHQLDEEVTSEKTARHFGSGQVDVYATPAMIALMEKTALESVGSLLPEGYTTVGTEVNVKHLKATAPAKQVRAESYLRKVEGIRLFFELHAWDERGMIGIGTHTRVIVNENEFMEKLK